MEVKIELKENRQKSKSFKYLVTNDLYEYHILYLQNTLNISNINLYSKKKN